MHCQSFFAAHLRSRPWNIVLCEDEAIFSHYFCWLQFLYFYQHWDHFGALALFRDCICSSLLGGRMFQHRMVRKVAPQCVTKAEECSFTHVQSACYHSIALLHLHYMFAHQQHWGCIIAFKAASLEVPGANNKDIKRLLSARFLWVCWYLHFIVSVICDVFPSIKFHHLLYFQCQHVLREQNYSLQ